MGRRKIKKDYSKKNYRNTLFNKRKKSLKKKEILFKIKIFLSILLFFLFLSLFFYLLYGNPLRIKNIYIIGNNKIKSTEIENFISNKINKSKIIPRYNYFLIGNNLTEDLKSNFYFKNIKLTKKFPNKISVEVEEKTPKFILMIENKKYLIDDQGTTMGPVKDENQKEINDLIKIVVTNKIINKDKLYTSNNQIINKKEIFFIYKIIDFLNKKNLIVERFEKKQPKELDVILKRNIKILFNTDKEINNQLKKLKIIISKLEVIKEYIDLRFDDKLYYK